MANKNEFFDGLRDAMAEGIEALRDGKVLTSREVVCDSPVPMSPQEIRRLRTEKLGVSQSVFAALINVAIQTVHAWEQGRTRPSGCALRFLRMIDEKPEVVSGLIERRQMAAR